MTTKITLIFDNPGSAEVFERATPTFSRSPARSPACRTSSPPRVWSKEDDPAAPAYRLIDLYLPDDAAASKAVTSPEAGDVRALASGLPAT